MTNLKTRAGKLHATGSARQEAFRRNALTWKADIIGRIESVAKELIVDGSASAASPFIVSQYAVWDGLPSVQIERISSRYFLRGEDFREGNPALSHEKSAKLVYSLHQGGTVHVVAFPHRSDVVEPHAESYVVDVLPSPYELAGSQGSRRIRGHLKLFLRLCDVTDAFAVPTRRSGAFLGKLRRRARRYERIFGSDVAARQASLSGDIALAAGLVAGLASSAVIPFARDIGTQYRTKVNDLSDRCRAPKINTEICLGREYRLDNFIASALSTPSLLLISVMLALTALAVMRSYFKQT